MNKLNLIVVFWVLVSLSAARAQLAIPEVEAVYGGRINAITGYAHTLDSSRIFITTESANTAFYADVKTGMSPTIGTFKVLPALDATAGYGGQVQQIAAVQNCGALLFATQGFGNGLQATLPPYNAVTNLYTGGMVADVEVADSTVLWVVANQLYWGVMSYDGTFSLDPASPLTFGAGGGMMDMAVHPVNGQVYIFHEGSTQLYRSSDAVTALSNTTTFTASAPSLSASAMWRTLGIAPDGRIFLGGATMGGSGMPGKWIAYTDDEVTWTDFNSGVGGTNGSVFSFMGAGTYFVGYGSMYSDNKGESGSWANFGNLSRETNPNDGACLADPADNNIVYLTTDQGIGASLDKGPNIFEINDGVEAVQVQDFTMTPDKNTAWIAAKSGIRRVTNYLTSPTWTNALFPMGDGSPYFSAEMDALHPDTVLVGNLRIYRTRNDGGNWERVFTPEVAPWNFANVGTEVQAIEICPFAPHIVMAGFTQRDADKGGLFVSTQGGDNGSWSQLLLHTSTTGDDVDVYDIEFTQEGSDTVAYIGVEYDLGAPTGRSVYRLVKTATGWTVAQDMTAATTSTGSLIVATIIDLEVSSTGDTVFAAGTDAGVNHPICYFKPLNGSNLWTPLTTSGFPAITGKKGKAVALGIDTLYCAVDNEVYVYPMGAASWALGYSYPVGTDINFLYFDDLLAGTGIGLFQHPIDGIPVFTQRQPTPTPQLDAAVFPNPVTDDQVTVTLHSPKGTTLLASLYDASGRLVRQWDTRRVPAGSAQWTLDLPRLSSGLYYLHLRTPYGTKALPLLFR